MVSRRNIFDGIPFVAVMVLSVLYLAEWRRSKAQLVERETRMEDRTNALREWVALESGRVSALVRGVRHELAWLKNAVAAATEVERRSERAEATDRVPEPSVDDRTGREPEVVDLPPLPEDIHDPVVFVRGLSPSTFFADPERNPTGKEFTGSERIRIGCEIAIGRNRIDILDKEIQILCSENMDWMREQGDYIEYARGERPIPAGSGIISVGETTENDTTRIYYFDPDGFEDIYAKKAEQREIGENLVRRLLLFAQS